MWRQSKQVCPRHKIAALPAWDTQACTHLSKMASDPQPPSIENVHQTNPHPVSTSSSQTTPTAAKQGFSALPSGPLPSPNNQCPALLRPCPHLFAGAEEFVHLLILHGSTHACARVCVDQRHILQLHHIKAVPYMYTTLQCIILT